MRKFLIPILALSFLLLTPTLKAQSQTPSATPPSGSLPASGPLLCIPEATLEAIVLEEVSQAVDLAVRAAVAEERGKRVEAEVALANAQIDLDRARRRGRVGWYVAGSLGAVLVSWFTFALIDAYTPPLVLP